MGDDTPMTAAEVNQAATTGKRKWNRWDYMDTVNTVGRFLLQVGVFIAALRFAAEGVL